MQLEIHPGIHIISSHPNQFDLIYDTEINDISKAKDLSFGEQKILENAFNRLVKELSASLKQKEDTVHTEIKGLLNKEGSINV